MQTLKALFWDELTVFDCYREKVYSQKTGENHFTRVENTLEAILTPP